MKFPLLCAALTSFAIASTPPANWGDFQFGMVNSTRSAWDGPMKSALDQGVKLDRRWTYANDPQEIYPWGSNAFLFTNSYNYAKDPYYLGKGVRATLTVYMLQHAADGLDAVKNQAANATFMKDYFKSLMLMVDSAKGTKPIYVIEPDVWGYLIQNFASDTGEVNLKAVAHINDLGYPELAEFKNEMRDLPKAIIKVIKQRDPQAYAGILMAHWGFIPQGSWGEMVNLSDAKVIEAAQGAAAFARKLLGPTYVGDFMGVEKNGADAGYWKKLGAAFDKWYWNDDQNRKFVLWSKTLNQSLNMPILGWQICAGHMGLPNVDNRYEDTFFPYFFSHVQDFIDAGFIGIMAGSANQDRGTIPTMTTGTGDDGWFYQQLNNFNAKRPYLQANTPIKTFSSKLTLDNIDNGIVVSGSNSWLQVIDPKGKILASWKNQDGIKAPINLAPGQYFLREGQSSISFQVTR